jgi:hypothetical protein
VSTIRHWVLSVNSNSMLQNEVAGCVVFRSAMATAISSSSKAISARQPTTTSKTRSTPQKLRSMPKMRRCRNEVNGEICMLAQEFHWIADQLVDAEKLLQADDAEAYLQD